jgi:putative glutamine amidotransferase
MGIARRKVEGAIIVALLAMGCAATHRSIEPPMIGVTSMVVSSRAMTGRDGPAGMITPMSYVDAVKQAGAIPVVVPPLPDADTMAMYVARLDGLVLIGGRDIPPAAYGEEAAPQVVPMERQRWDFESELVRRWLETDKPVLGICLGSQIANVVQGGTLIQDIPTEVGDDVSHRAPDGAWHKVTIDGDSQLHEILGESEVLVWTRHHQSVERVGDGLAVVAQSDDGVVEAMEMRQKPFAVFVQWHPERMEGTEHRRRLFEALVDAAETTGR